MWKKINQEEFCEGFVGIHIYFEFYCFFQNEEWKVMVIITILKITFYSLLFFF